MEKIDTIMIRFYIVALIIGIPFGLSVFLSAEILNAFQFNIDILPVQINTFGNAVALVGCLYLFIVNALPVDKGVSIIAICIASILPADYSILSLNSLMAKETLNPTVVNLTLDMFTDSIIVFASYYLLLSFSFVRGKRSLTVSALAASPCFLIFLLALMSTTFSPISKFIDYLAHYRNFIIACFPFALASITIFDPNLRLANTKIGAALKARFHLIKSNRSCFYSISMISALSFLTLIIQAYDPKFAFQLPFLNWAAIIGILHTHLKQFQETYSDASLKSIVVDQNASEYLQRHFKKENNWAATSGIRTASFIIDHSVAQEIEKIPATLQQIRSQIIKDSTLKVLGHELLNYNIWNDKIYGSVNPERTEKPCIQAIMLFTCLYMDGIPLLERRLKTLTNILPIIDEGSSKIVNEKSVNSLMQRNTWLFYLDYTWVDQHLIHVDNKAHYQYEAKIINEQQKYLVAAELKKRNLLGNYIWISDSARKQIEQESPHLTKVFIPVELKVHGDDNQIIFLMKFEDLIPRLQRYYLLDHFRDVLKDRTQDKDSKRLCNLIELQLSQEFDINRTNEILESIRSFPWQGFKAKDSALELVLELYKKTKEHIARRLVDKQQQDKMLENYKHLYISVINEIGYPSQYLHLAQIKKHTMRNEYNNFDILGDPSHKNFYELWLFMSSTPLSGSEKDILETLNFLETIHRKNWGQNAKFVRTKSIATLNQIPRRFAIKHKPKIETTLNIFYEWLLFKFDFDELMFLLDTHTNLNIVTKNQINISKKVMDSLRRLENFTPPPGSVEEMKKLAFTSRLQKIFNPGGEDKSQSPKAFLSESA